MQPGGIVVTVLREIIEVDVRLQDAFDAVADFSSSERWDPGVASARRIAPGTDAPSGVGATYALTVTFRGTASDMTYTTTAYEEPHRVVLEGVGPKIRAIDTIEFAATPSGGTRITYTADLRLTGAAKIAAPFLGGAFEEMGHKALAGMQAWLEEGRPGTASSS
jgi:carbon monoxide dehydrogenase subunit G